VRVWGKLETHAEYSTEQSQRSSQIAYRSESDYTLKKIPAMTGGHALMSPLATPLVSRSLKDKNNDLKGISTTAALRDSPR